MAVPLGDGEGATSTSIPVMLSRVSALCSLWLFLLCDWAARSSSGHGFRLVTVLVVWPPFRQKALLAETPVRRSHGMKTFPRGADPSGVRVSAAFFFFSQRFLTSITLLSCQKVRCVDKCIRRFSTRPDRAEGGRLEAYTLRRGSRYFSRNSVVLSLCVTSSLSFLF